MKIINHHNENIFHSTKYPYCVIRKNNWLKESKSIAEKLKVNVFNNKVIEKENSYYVNGKKLNGEYIFDSRPPNFDNNILLQHFHGIEIECDEDKFDFKTAILMDFRCDQSKGIHFIYFLPFSKKRALVESTLFSNKVARSVFNWLSEFPRAGRSSLDAFPINENRDATLPFLPRYIERKFSI